MTDPKPEDVIEANIQVHTRMAESYNRNEPHYRPENRAKVRAKLEQMRRFGSARLLDIGCGTGGFAVGIAERTAGRVIGIDLTPRFIQYAGRSARSVTWLIGDAARLPISDRQADCAIMSLLLHRVPEPATVIAEAYRVLRTGGTLLIRTVSPEDAAESVPYRFFPTIAAAQRDRMPATTRLTDWASGAGFNQLSVQRIEREIRINTDQLEQQIRADVPARYPDVTSAELAAGLRQLHADATQQIARIATVVIARR